MIQRFCANKNKRSHAAVKTPCATVLTESLRALDLTGTKATGADIHCLMRTVDNCFHATDIGFPSSVGLAVGVRYVVSERDAFSANAAICHFDTS